MRLTEKDPFLRALLDNVQDGVLACDPDGVIVLANDRASRIAGRRGAGMVGASIDAVLPGFFASLGIGDFSTWIAETQARSETLRLELPGTAEDTTRAVELRVAGAVAPDGALALVLMRERGESERVELDRALADRIESARADERKRLARELHDDLGQRLNLLGMEVELLWEELSGDRASEGGEDFPAQRVGLLRERVSGLVRASRDLSHRLHPSAAEVIHLGAALRKDCESISSTRHLVVETSIEDLSEPLDDQVALGLYRVAQEAMHNAVKHSSSPRIRVELGRDGNDVVLRVRDAGRGFDVDAKKSGGLGLSNMEERVRAMGGRLSIRSRAGSGTTVEVSVPVPPRDDG